MLRTVPGDNQCQTRGTHCFCEAVAHGGIPGITQAYLDNREKILLRCRREADELREQAPAGARDSNALCKAHGFVPPASLQQRTLFDEVVRPMAQESGTTALVVGDALRFEMAEEL